MAAGSIRSSFFSLKLALSLPLLMAMATVISAAVAGVIGYSAIQRQVAEHREAALATTAARVEHVVTGWLRSGEKDLEVLANSPAMRDALKQFSAAWRHLPGEAGTLLQNAYVRNNPYPDGERHLLVSTRAVPAYDVAHGLFHPFLRRLRDSKHVQDIVLFDTDANVVYSVSKSAGFAMNVRSGKGVTPGLTKAFDGAMKRAADGTAIFIDMTRPDARQGQGAGYLARSINDRSGTVIGVIAFQISRNNIQTLIEGLDLGSVGHNVVLSGPDRTLRTAGGAPSEPRLPLLRSNGAGIDAALGGQTGVDRFKADTGERMISVYRPMTFKGITWAIAATGAQPRIPAFAGALSSDLLWYGAPAMLILLVTGIIAGRSLSRPLARLEGAVRDLATGDGEQEIPGQRRRDEIGSIARSVETLRSRLFDDGVDSPSDLLWRCAFWQSSGAAMALDRDFDVVAANPALTAMLESRIDDLRDRWPDLEPADLVGSKQGFIADFVVACRDTLPGADTPDVELVCGEVRLSATLTPLTDDSGTLIGTLAEWRDTTDTATRDNVIEAICRNQCVAEYDRNGVLLRANERFASAFAADAETLAGMPHQDFCPEEQLKDGGHTELWTRLLSGDVVEGRFSRVARDGREVFLRAIYIPVDGADGSPLKIVEIASIRTDIEQLTRQQNRTLEAISRHQAMLELTPDGTITGVNQNFLEITGYDESDLVGRPHRILFASDDPTDDSYQALQDGLERGEPQIGVWRYDAKDGADLYLQTIFSPVQLDDGTITRFVACSSNVTETETERLRKKTQLQHKEADQNTVVSALSAGLNALSSGRLTARLDAPFSAEYEQLRVNFNDSIEKLQSAMLEVMLKSQGIRGSAAQISQSTDDLAKRTESQAGSLEQTAAAIEELTSSVKSSAERAQVAEDATGKARKDAASGEAVVKNTIAAMNEIDQSSEKISEIIGVIEDIAFQTNLLALNAGVEAARAGDAGRGFAVVASEVRALAQRCSDAAKEIKELISESSDHVKRGVDLVGRTGSALDAINTSVVEIASLVQSIATSSKEQSIGLSEINSAVARLDEVTQQNAAMVEETTAASHDLTTDAEELAGLIGRFQIDDPADEQAAWRAAEERPADRRQVAISNSRDRILAPPEDRVSAVKGAPEPVDEGWEDF